MAMSRSFGGTVFTTRVPIWISPPVMVSSPATMRRRVDFPQPDGPTRMTNSPSAMSRETPCSTFAAPKLFSTWRIFTEAIGVFSRLTGIVTAPPAIATAASRLPRFREQDEFPLPADEGAGIGFGEAPAPALVEAPGRGVLGEAFEGRRAVGLRR